MDVVCELCPKRCTIPDGTSGECRVRVNLDGTLRSVVYGRPCAVHIDPIEKKPLFHFLPGSKILSMATAGCNLHCKNCQNWEISQANPEETPAYVLPPDELVALAKKKACPSIAYTYTEPIIYYEYTLDTAMAAKEAGIKSVTVTAGYGNPAPLAKLFAQIDATNTDLKALDDTFYRTVCGASLGPVLDGLILAKELGVWVEVTNLVIPTLNDDPALLEALFGWLLDNLGADTPLHLSRFSPRHQMKSLPPTPAATLVDARARAMAMGLRYVYIGNVYTPGGEDTVCPHDGTLLIGRAGYTIKQYNLVDGCCPTCGAAIPGVWS